MYRQDQHKFDSHSHKGIQTGGRERSYKQIASILTEREGVSVSTKEVQQICGIAEVKLILALLADEVLCEELDLDATSAIAALRRREVCIQN